MILGSHVKKAETTSFVKRGFERLGLGRQTVVCRGIHIELNRVRSRSLSPRGGLWGSSFWPFFPALFSGSLVPLFILACIPYPSSTCKLNFLGLKTRPVSPYLKWLGVVVKAEEHGSVRCRVLNGNNSSFPFVLGRYTIQHLLLYWHRYFRFFSQTVPIPFLPISSKRISDMPRTESSSAMSQNYLDFYYTSSAIPFLGSGLGLQCKNGPGPQIIGPHNSPSKSCCPTSWSGRRVLVMPSLYYGSFSFAFH